MPVRKPKMSNPISLNCYTIRFREKNKTGFQKIKDVFNPNSFKKEMSHFLSSLEKFSFTNENNNRILYLTESLTLEDNIVSGVMKRGHNGQESDIDELVEGKANTISSVKSTQFNSIYFYFLIAIPDEKSDYLIFIAQTFKQYGFKDLFAQCYKQYIDIRYNEQYNSVIYPLTIPKLFSKYIKEGDIRKLSFRKHSLPENAENLLGENDNKNVKDYEVEMSIRAKKQGFTGVKSINFETTSFVEVYDIGFEYDDAYADVSINGRKRILNITNPEKFTASYDITDKVKLQPQTERPVYKDLDNEAIKILKEEILLNL